jgi:glycosyltransferase involved in cell wall biosynthesis
MFIQAVDGFGWYEDQPAPLAPLASLLFHFPHAGLVNTLKAAKNLFLRRLTAQVVDVNVAVSAHLDSRQCLPRQVVIYNPFEMDSFGRTSLSQAKEDLANSDCTFAFLGRLVSGKGIFDLVRAFATICDQRARLKIIGDGPDRLRLEQLVAELGLNGQVVFSGLKTGDELVAEVRKSGIFVLPSIWEEPMGIVGLELMAAGKPLIVSQVGGLSECTGPAALKVPNGNVSILAETMTILRGNLVLQHQLMEASLERVQQFRPDNAVEEYLSMFRTILSGK